MRKRIRMKDIKKRKRWSLRYTEGNTDDALAVRDLVSSLAVSSTMAKLLCTRGYKTPDAVRAFLQQEESQLHDPFLLQDIEPAIERISLALERGERIAVYGDYDVDGVTSLSLLYLYLCEFGADVGYYIPCRSREGYGLSTSAIDTLKERGVELIITVDTGITAIDEINTPEALTDLYNQVCFYKDFSDAYAVSIPYKLHLMGLELVEDGQGDLTVLEQRLPKYADALRRQENRRFEAFMRSKGWTQMLPGEVDNVLLRDKLCKRHARLTLQYTDVLERMTGRNFAEEDLRSINALPATIRLANALYGKQYSVRTKT